MSTTGGGAEGRGSRHFRENTPGLDPGDAARVVRLLRWYPTQWRERYGDEFSDVLARSMSDGRGNLRLSFNVAREGVVARLEQAGFIGRLARPLQRARASVVAILLATLTFLASAAVLIRYAKGWQRTPALETLTQAGQVLDRSKAWHTWLRTLASPAVLQLQQAANHSLNGNSQAGKAYEGAQAQAASALYNSDAYRTYQQAVHILRPAAGAPVVFNEVAQVALLAALICLGSALLVASVAGVRALRRGNKKVLRVPIALLLGSAILFVVGGIAYEADHKIPPGQPGSEWTTVKLMVLEGHFRFWPVVVLPVCAIGSIVLATVGSLQLIRRVEMGPRLCRFQGFLATVTAGCLGIFLVSTLSWIATLYEQAPSFLTAKGQGIFGTPLLPVFLLAIVVMSAALWIIVSGSARCLRNVRPL
jgi:hypothetical protein